TRVSRRIAGPGAQPSISPRPGVPMHIRFLVRTGLAIALFLAIAVSLHAQSYEDIGTRAQGMAGAFVAVADDASATWWNPAGLATARNAVDFSAEISEGGRGGVALAFPSLGLSYYRNKISKIQPSGSTASVGSSRQDNGAVGS